MIELSDATQYLLSRVRGDLLIKPETFLEQLRFESAMITIMKNKDNETYFLSELEELQRRH
jgi:hypothetical protein